MAAVARSVWNVSSNGKLYKQNAQAFLQRTLPTVQKFLRENAADELVRDFETKWWGDIIKPQAKQYARLSLGHQDFGWEEELIWNEVLRTPQLLEACVAKVQQESEMYARFEQKRSEVVAAFSLLCTRSLEHSFIRPLLACLDINYCNSPWSAEGCPRIQTKFDALFEECGDSHRFRQGVVESLGVDQFKVLLEKVQDVFQYMEYCEAAEPVFDFCSLLRDAATEFDMSAQQAPFEFFLRRTFPCVQRAIIQNQDYYLSDLELLLLCRCSERNVAIIKHDHAARTLKYHNSCLPDDTAPITFVSIRVREGASKARSHFERLKKEERVGLPAAASSSLERSSEVDAGHDSDQDDRAADVRSTGGLSSEAHWPTTDLLRLVSINVAGLAPDLRSPAERMREIIKELLEQHPDVIFFQEMVDAMYTVLKECLPDWDVKRRSRVDTEYYVTTAVRSQRQSDADSTRSKPFSESSQGRHSLTVVRAGVEFVNVHAESGRDLNQMEARSAQLLQLAQVHEAASSGTTILAGDFNVRDGEDAPLLKEGWQDAWRCAENCFTADGDWTWKQGMNKARYDRVFFRADAFKCQRCLPLTEFWPALSDHRPLLVELQRHRAPSSSAAAINSRGGCGFTTAEPDKLTASTSSGTGRDGAKMSGVDTQSAATSKSGGAQQRPSRPSGLEARQDSLQVMNAAVHHVSCFRAARDALKLCDRNMGAEQRGLATGGNSAARMGRFAFRGWLQSCTVWAEGPADEAHFCQSKPAASCIRKVLAMGQRCVWSQRRSLPRIAEAGICMHHSATWLQRFARSSAEAHVFAEAFAPCPRPRDASMSSRWASSCCSGRRGALGRTGLQGSRLT